MNKCYNCKDKEGETIVDNKTYCQECYSTISKLLFNGVWTTGEAQQSIEEWKEYNKEIDNFIKSIRQRNIQDNEIRIKNSEPKISSYDYLEQILMLEKNVIHAKFNKTRECITPKEHKEVINYIYLSEKLEPVYSIITTNCGDEVTKLKEIYRQGIMLHDWNN